MITWWQSCWMADRIQSTTTSLFSIPRGDNKGELENLISHTKEVLLFRHLCIACPICPFETKTMCHFPWLLRH